MKKNYAFGVFSAFFVSCSNGGLPGEGDCAADASGFSVGKELSYDGDKYLVLKNVFVENSDCSARAVVQ